MQEKEQDFGIPDDSGSKLEGLMPLPRWPGMQTEHTSESSSPDEATPELVKVKPPKTKTKTKTDLTPLLNALQVEIEETMDLLRLVQPTVLIIGGEMDEFKINILCRKVSASLMRIQDIRDKIAQTVEG